MGLAKAFGWTVVALGVACVAAAPIRAAETAATAGVLRLQVPDASEPPPAPVVVEALRAPPAPANHSLVHPGFGGEFTAPGDVSGYGAVSGFSIASGIRSLSGGTPSLSTPGLMTGMARGFGLEFAAGINLGRWSTGPVLGIAAAGVPFGGFTPRGAALPLGFEASMAAERTIQSLGWEVSYLAVARSWALQPYARLSYEVESQGLLRDFGPAGLNIARGGFGIDRERSYFSLGGGLATRLDNSFSLRLGYTAEVDRFDGWRQRFMTTLGYTF